MHNQSDYGYSTGAVSMRCIACGSMELNCCDGTMPTPQPRYYVEREDYVTAPDHPDYFVMDRQTGLAVDVSTIEARALSYCDTLNKRDTARA